MKTHIIYPTIESDVECLIMYIKAKGHAINTTPICAIDFNMDAFIESLNNEPATLFVYHPRDIWPSTGVMIKAIQQLARARVSLHICYGNSVFNYQDYNFYSEQLLDFMADNDRAIRSACSRVKTDVKRGRPADPKNRFKAIEKYRLDVYKYLQLGVNRDKIAEMVQTDRLTLEDFIKTHGLDKERTTVEKPVAVKQREAA